MKMIKKGKTNLNIVLLKYTYSLILYEKQIHLHRLWCHQWVLMKPLPNWLGKLRLLFNYRFDYCDKMGPTLSCILTQTSSGLLPFVSQFGILEQRQATKCDLIFSNSIYATFFDIFWFISQREKDRKWLNFCCWTRFTSRCILVHCKRYLQSFIVLSIVFIVPVHWPIFSKVIYVHI